MPDFNINNPQPVIVEGGTPKTDVTPVEGTNDNKDKSVNGLSAEELNDVSKISVTIADTKAPITILFGSPACGKTMTLIRLTRYLKKIGYVVQPVRSFRPNYDTNYVDLCNNFDLMVNSSDAADSTNRISFMLVNVIKGGKTLCQLMEAPGEHYFDPKKPFAPFPRYLNNIINGNNRKIWLFMVEPVHTNKNMPDVSDRRNFVNKVHKVKQKMNGKDQSIFVYNKIDETPFVISRGKVNITAARKDVSDNYPNIFEPFKNQNPITKYVWDFNFDFIPFQTGDFSQTSDNKYTFEEGPDEYPKKLWNSIMDKVRG